MIYPTPTGLSDYQKAIRKERNLKLAFFLAGVFLFFFALLKVDNLLVSFVLAIVTYSLLVPWVNFLERRRLSRTWATIIPFAVLSIILGVSAWLFTPPLLEQAASLQKDLPKYIEGTTSLFHRVDEHINAITKDIYPISASAKLQTVLLAWAEAVARDLPSYISRSLTVIFLTPLLAFSMLIDGGGLVRTILTFVPNNIFELALNLNHRIASQMSSFIRARLMESVLVTLIIWTGLSYLNFSYALVLAIVAGLLNLIPYVGPVIGALPAFLISFINHGTTGTEPLELLGIYAFAQLFDAAVVVPVVVAKIVNLHPVTVVLSILVGSQVMGILGMIISIPVVSALKVTISAIYEHMTDFRG